MQHLEHFCATLPRDDYATNRPIFSFEEDIAGLIRGTVILPTSVHPAVRRTSGKAWWRTERAATKETAFQAYKALYEYGLVNDNLLPLTKKPELRFTEATKLPSIVDCSEQYDPYVDLAHAWQSPELCHSEIRLSKDGLVNEELLMSIVLPKLTVMPDPFSLFWERDVTWLVSLQPPKLLSSDVAALESINVMRTITSIYLQAPSSRFQGPGRDFVCLFIPTISITRLQDWVHTYNGTEKVIDVYARNAESPLVGIVRNTALYSEPRLFRKWLVSSKGESVQLEVECQSLPRRRNLLQAGTIPLGEDGEPGPPKIYVVPAESCTVDRLPDSQAIFGLVISAILDRFEATFVAKRLNETILKGVGIQDLRHVLTAITTPLAQANTHYQRYEFFGDSVLKFTVGCQLFLTQPTWHEGYLSEGRDRFVQNNRLARAALDSGLDEFILTRRFTPRKWNAPIISQKLDSKPRRRELSAKLLADVVEALIGAAYMDGGMQKAQTCLHRFLPEVNIFTNNIGPLIIPCSGTVSNLIDQYRIATLIGYTFNDPSLLTEALTHASCGGDVTTQSYQRMEYLGDAVLDMIVVSVLAAHPIELPQGKMTMLKHAVVNTNLLAFLCMNLSVTEETTTITQTASGDTAVAPSLHHIHLWQFLRSRGPVLPAARDAIIGRYRAVRDKILAALDHAPNYPWELLAQIRTDKFMSDIIESIMGAIFIDSKGDLDVCTAFAERIGLLPYLRRLLSDDVDVSHPRNLAQNLVKYTGTLIFKSKRVEKKGHGATYHCTAILNKQVLAFVEGSPSSELAEIQVAYLVIDRIAAGTIGSE